MLAEPLKFFGIVEKVVKKISTNTNDITVKLTIVVSDHDNKKAEVLRKSADMEAMEYFEIIIRNEGRSD